MTTITHDAFDVAEKCQHSSLSFQLVIAVNIDRWHDDAPITHTESLGQADGNKPLEHVSSTLHQGFVYERVMNLAV